MKIKATIMTTTMTIITMNLLIIKAIATTMKMEDATTTTTISMLTKKPLNK